MENKADIGDYINKNELEEFDIAIKEDNPSEENAVANSQEKLAIQAAALAANVEFSDETQYPENPFSYFESNQINVQLSNGSFRYEVVDFILPGRDGFDISIARRYDSGSSNLVDMDPSYGEKKPRVAFSKDKKFKTGSRTNNHYTQTYGLGYGWSFVLPSIEAVPFLDIEDDYVELPTINGEKDGYWDTFVFAGYHYFFHHEDGRSLKINRVRDSFLSNSYNDLSIITKSGSISHPYSTVKAKSYVITIQYKNGTKDYFNNASGVGGARDGMEAQQFKLVAREDKFGNVIFYDLQDDGGMTIVDTWGRSLILEKTGDGLNWKLPRDASGNISELSYQIDRKGSLKLTGVKDLAGSETKYTYYNQSEKKGKMKFGSQELVGNDSGEEERQYLLLNKITNPNGAQSQFEYQGPFTIENGAGGYIDYFPLSVRTDIVGERVYNRTSYAFRRSEKLDYVEYADIKKHQDIQETYHFDNRGLLLEKEVRNQNTPVSKSEYQYKNKLMTYASDKFFGKSGKSEVLEKKTYWVYDDVGNISQEREEYPNDSALNQEINTTYGSYNIVTEISRKKGTDTIYERYELYPDSKKWLIKCKRIYVKGENDKAEVLKEKTVYDYEDVNNPYCVTSEKRYVADSSGNLEQSGDYMETAYTYNSGKYTHNWVTREQKGIKDADGKSCESIKELLDYDPWGRVIKKTDPKNQVTTISYDALGRVEKETFPSVDGRAITNETHYNDISNYITETDANQNKRRIKYNPFGEVSQVCLATANQPSTADIVLKNFNYNTWGELTEVYTYDGNGTAAGNVKKTELYTYDSFGRVLSRSIPQVGYEETYGYDEVILDPEGGTKYYYHEKKTVKGDSSDSHVVTDVYKDLKGQIRKEFLAEKRKFTYDYDNAGNNIRKVDALNKAEQWEYDYAGRVMKTIRMDAGQERIVRLEYDALGNKRFSWDEADNKTEYQYDSAGRLIQTIAPFDDRSQKVKYYYDGSGNITWEKKTQKDGWQETQHVYDARSRLTDTYQYLTTTNWIRTRYQYDAMDRVTSMRTGDTPSGDGEQVTKYTYDRFGNVVTKTDARGCTESFEYDKVGRRQAKTDRKGNRTVYQYDALERLVKETVSCGTADGTVVSEREYDYGKIGKLIQEVSRESEEGKQTVNLVTRYYYNEKGQLSKQEDPGNAEKIYTYDASGNRQSFQLTRTGQAAADVSLYYLYDDLNRLTQVRKGSAAGIVLAEYEYDKKGNRKTQRYPQAGIETSYGYNQADRVTSLESKRQGTVISSWEYSYDLDGNLLAKTDKSSSPSVTISYNYDRLGRLAEEDHPGWKRTLYTYDAYSNRIKMMVEGKTKDELVSVTNYEYDRNNWLKKETRKQGKITEIYLYRYDANGNENFRIWEKTAPRPDYPGSVKLSGSWKREMPTVYEWRHYNGFGQLIRVNQDDKEITYQYRGDGLRHSSGVRELTESQSKTKVFYWDDDNIVAEQTDGGSVKCYLRGINLIAAEADGVVYYYLLNEHGDVAQLWGQNGTCKASYEYDAFGVERNPKEEDENPFRYCGEYYDLSSSTYYLRARDYRPATGRFLTEDKHWNSSNMIYGDQEKQNDKHIIDMKGLSWLNNGVIMPDIEAVNQSTNLYMYCMNNPIRYSDKNGEVALLAAIAIGAVVGAVISASIELGMQLWRSKSLAEVEWGRVGIQAATGAVSGGLAASGVGIFGQIVGNAAISGISNAATQKIYTGKINTFELGVSIGVGAALGVIGGKGAYNGANKFSVSYVTQGSYLLRHDVIRYIDSDIAEKAVAETLKAITRSSAAGVLIEQVKGFTNQVVSRQNGAYLYN